MRIPIFNYNEKKTVNLSAWF